MARSKNIDNKFISILSLSVIVFSLVTLIGLSQNKTSFRSSASRGGEDLPTVVLSSFDPSTVTSTIRLPANEYFNQDLIEVRYYPRDLSTVRYDYEEIVCQANECSIQTQINGDANEAGFSLFNVGKTTTPIKFRIADGVAKDWMVVGGVGDEWTTFALVMPEYPLDGETISVTQGSTVKKLVKVLSAASGHVPPESIEWQFTGPRGVAHEVNLISETETPYAFYSQTWELSLTNNTFTGTAEATLKAISGTSLNQFPAAEFTISSN